MIQRVVLVKLKPSFATPETLALIARETEATLGQAHGVRGVEVGTASDGRTRSAWDVCILVRFDHMDDVETYRTDKVHRAYADVFLKPMQESIHVFNFELA